MSFSHVTAPTQYVEANGIRFAFRRLGKETGVPLLFLQHFRGGMDHWDPLITDGFAADLQRREVRGEPFAELKRIKQPTLVVNGNNDVMVPTINSFTLCQHMPNAQLIIYPNANHASHYQYPDLFLSHARTFLERNDFGKQGA